MISDSAAKKYEEKKYIICIGGLSASGKNTVGELVAEKLGLRHIEFTFKDEAKKRGLSLMEFQQLASKSPEIDKEMDKKIAEEAEKGKCVVTTWLGPWIVKNADLRVWLYAEEKIRSERLAKRDGISVSEALAHIRAREKNNQERYLKYYDIDINDSSIFDIKFDAGKMTPEEIADKIIKQVERNA